MENRLAPPSLRELQLWMKWIITDPRGVTAALADPSPSNRPHIERYSSPTDPLLHWIADTPPIDRTERLDIYAEAYFTRVFDSMRADFPITARVLGDSSFRKLVADYLKQYPSGTFNIGDIGKNLSPFVAHYEDLKNAEFLEPIVDMEWRMITSFYAKDSRIFDSANLASLSDEDWENARFKLAPSTHLMPSDWPIDQFWRLRDESTELESIPFEKLNEKQYFLINREIGVISIEKISNAEHSILTKLASGISLGAALAESQKELANEDIGPQLNTWFSAWIQRGILCDLEI